ncbi:hypothetical protein GQ53DRAFT_37784 [Thozetella sp. PMI_491]|nr:hypothetical protein GQ53DRAFT_37784 [Thozetella sp. PMI_491]
MVYAWVAGGARCWTSGTAGRYQYQYCCLHQRSSTRLPSFLTYPFFTLCTLLLSTNPLSAHIQTTSLGFCHPPLSHNLNCPPSPVPPPTFVPARHPSYCQLLLPPLPSLARASTMAVAERQELVNHCCSFCCKAIDFGTHDYCPGSAHCARCPY